MEIFDKTMLALEKKLDVHFKRHTILASNVANVETPNYRAREVDFAGEVEKMLDGTSKNLIASNDRHLTTSGVSGAMGGDSSHIVMDDSGTVRADGNNVDLDLQMGKISSNNRSYQGSVNLLQIKLRIYRLLSRGGGGM